MPISKKPPSGAYSYRGSLLLAWMASRSGAAGQGKLLFRPALHHAVMASEAGCRDVVGSQHDIAVVDDLKVAALRQLILGVMASGGAAVELRRYA